ncbi:MAG TPA: NAD-glutamate dehydrogenase, partial [Spongiibacteraceae bacterium]|nr:NAD-glutamate dehydrogenase [Spongiibacteraceae bacterium]
MESHVDQHTSIDEHTRVEQHTRAEQDTLIEQLRSEIVQRLPSEQAPQVLEFTRQFYDKFPLQELRGRPLSDLYASTYGGWHFLQHYDDSRPKVRIFNPDFEQHGWQLQHTVVAVLCRDMPFVLDSVRGELNSRNISIITIHSASLQVRRDDQQRLLQLMPRNGADGSASTEAFLYLEINRHSNPDDLAQLQQAIEQVLREVECVVDDFAALRARCAEVRNAIAVKDDAEAGAAQAFTDWLLDDNFTFLGYEYLQVSADGDKTRIERSGESALGLLRARGSSGADDLAAELAGVNDDNSATKILIFSKSSLRTRVHRRVYPDYVGVRVFGADGRVAAEHRFMGLYTSRVYTMPPAQIPVIADKVEAVLARAGFGKDSHERSELARVLEIHPRDELFHADSAELYETVLAIHQMQERRLVRLFVRRDSYGKYVSCLVYMPRDTYNTELRVRIQTLLCNAFAAREAEFSTFFSESILTRTHFILQIEPGQRQHRDSAVLQD